ncbi:hypothetical protein [Nocardioides donggukensis]|uniref:Uncharacterized protein n=1 Tax=Nocardioides donggukensis TaxID=2774019 RepID=A0A927K9W9_9ACTN|nr:hypothetical protein [Nocardioides donggukensis]MBD8870325.1 hypothetical protein [Nocardioides donggukensis]
MSVHLRRSDENSREIEALAVLLGGRVGLDGVLDDLNRRGRRAWGAFGRAVHRAVTWDAADRRDPHWWPQGISTSADATDEEDLEGRRVVLVSWYSKAGEGSRISFLDLDTLRYRHVLLVVPELAADGTVRLEPLKVHAGGIVWCGPYLHVAATARGFMTCRMDDLMRVPDDRAGALETHGYRYLLPVRFTYRADADEGHERMRFSFLSIDRGADPPALVAGEYGRHRQTTRLARFPLDPRTLHLVAGDDGVSRPVLLDDGGVVQMQGAVVARGRYHVTASKGPWTPGSVYVGGPGAFRRFRWATPIGPEDVSYWPSRDQLWSVTEHPRRRWVFSMRRDWFDRR